MSSRTYYSTAYERTWKNVAGPLYDHTESGMADRLSIVKSHDNFRMLKRSAKNSGR